MLSKFVTSNEFFFEGYALVQNIKKPQAIVTRGTLDHIEI